MTNSLLNDENPLSLQEKYTFLRDILTRQFYEDAQEILEEESEKGQENLEKTKGSSKENPFEERRESTVMNVPHKQKEARLTLSQEQGSPPTKGSPQVSSERLLGDGTEAMDLMTPPLMGALGLTSVAYSVPLRM